MSNKLVSVVMVSTICLLYSVVASAQGNDNFLLKNLLLKLPKVDIIKKEIPFKSSVYKQNEDLIYRREEDYFYESDLYFDKFKSPVYQDLFINKLNYLDQIIEIIKSNTYLDEIFLYDYLFLIQDINKKEYFNFLEVIKLGLENDKINQEILISAIDNRFFGNYYSNSFLKLSKCSETKNFIINVINSRKISRANKEYLSQYLDKNWTNNQLYLRKIKSINLYELQNDW